MKKLIYIIVLCLIMSISVYGREQIGKTKYYFNNDTHMIEYDIKGVDTVKKGPFRMAKEFHSGILVQSYETGLKGMLDKDLNVVIPLEYNIIEYLQDRKMYECTNTIDEYFVYYNDSFESMTYDAPDIYMPVSEYLPFMEVSAIAVVNTTVMTSLFILFVIFIIEKTKILPRVKIGFIYIIIIIIGLRLLLPFEFRFQKYIKSTIIMTSVRDFMRAPVLEISTVNICIQHFLAGLWILGAVIYLYRYFSKYYRLCRVAGLMPEAESGKACDILENLKTVYGFDFKTKLIVNKMIDFPAEFGIFKQTIFLNDYEYTDKEFEFILLHELAHYKNGSNIMNMFVSILCCLYWWNPIMWLFRSRIDEIVEIYVDDFVVNGLTKGERAKYMDCIFKVYNVINSRGTASFPAELITGKGRRNLILDRFKIISDSRVKNDIACAFLAIITLLYALSIGIIIQSSYGKPSEEDMSPIFDDINQENSYITYEDDGYYHLYYNGEKLIRDKERNVLEKIRDQ